MSTKRKTQTQESTANAKPWLDTDRSVVMEGAMTTIGTWALKSLFVTHDFKASTADFLLFPLMLMVPRFEYEASNAGGFDRRSYGDSMVAGIGASLISYFASNKESGVMSAGAVGLCALAAHSVSRYVGFAFFNTHHRIEKRLTI